MQEPLNEIAEAIQYGDKERARELLAPLLAANPSPEVYLLAAKASDDPVKAVEYLENSVKLDPQNAEANALLDRLREVLPAAPSSNAAPTQRAAPPETRPSTSTKPIKPAKTDSGTGEGVYEMLWDCRYCGAKKLLGKTHRFCPNCGSPQDPSWRYFPSDDEKVAVKDHVFTGADKKCESCGNLNGAAASHCGRCGAPLEGAQAVSTLGSRVKRAGERFEGEDLEARINAKLDADVGRVAPSAKSKSGRGKWVLPALGVAAVACIGIVLMAIFWTKTETVSVTDYRWEREIRIEQYQAISENVICSQMPSSAYDVTRRREQVDTRRVPDGETCQNVQVDQGDGTFKQERRCETKYRDEPVYGDMCYYKINRWEYERSVSSVGALANSLTWPETNLNANCIGSQLGCEREQNREENYILIFGTGDDQFECEVDFDTWNETKVETVFNVKVGVIGGGARCDSLERAGS